MYVGAFVAGLLILTSCQGGTPPVKVSKTGFPEFIVGGPEIEVLYENTDIDSCILRYRVTAEVVASLETTFRSIEKAAEQRNWKVIKQDATSVRFVRFYWGSAFFSVEDAQVVIIPQRLTVYVAWVQADSRKKVARIEDTSEGRWAARVVWPKLESYLAREKADLLKPGSSRK